jgi:hypothetical protein
VGEADEVKGKSHMLAGIWLFFWNGQSSGWDDNVYPAPKVAEIGVRFCELVHSGSRNLNKSNFKLLLVISLRQADE